MFFPCAIVIAEKKNGSGNLKKERILTVCGSGNNGGDGIAIARLLHLAGIRSEIYLAGNPDKMTEETRHQWDIAMSYQVPVMNNPVWDEYTVIVDGIFGVGLSRDCLLYTSPSPRDALLSRMPSSA